MDIIFLIAATFVAFVDDIYPAETCTSGADEAAADYAEADM